MYKLLNLRVDIFTPMMNLLNDKGILCYFESYLMEYYVMFQGLFV